MATHAGDDEHGHDVPCKYLSEFGDIVPVHGVADAELLVWTTISRAVGMGKLDQGSRRQQDLIQSAIRGGK